MRRHRHHHPVRSGGRLRACAAAIGIAALAVAFGACSDDGGDDAKLVEALFGAENNQLYVYNLQTGGSSVLIPAEQNNVNGQVCEMPDGSGNFLMGEDTNQDEGARQGWGIFSPEGTLIEKLLEPVTEGEAEQPEPFGCAFASDDRLFVSDEGSGNFDATDGKLILFFPPDYKESCVIASTIHVAGNVAVDDEDNVYLPQSVPPGEIFRFSNLPTSADQCAAKAWTQETFIQDPDMSTPLGIAHAKNGNWYISSVFIPTTIREYAPDGTFVRTVVQGDDVGNPAGLAVDSDGTLYYADLGLAIQEDGLPGPEAGKGTVRKVEFDADGNPQTPVVMNSNLTFPDSLGIVLVVEAD